MVGGGGGLHLPVVLRPTELALGNNRLRLNTGRVLSSTCHFRDARRDRYQREEAIESFRERGLINYRAFHKIKMRF